MILVNELEFNTNAYKSINRREFEMYLFPRAWYIQCQREKLPTDKNYLDN